MKKQAFSLLAAVVLLATSAGVSACHTHEFLDWQIDRPATCMQEGLKTRTCKFCTESQQMTIPKADHVAGEYGANATSHWKECTVCHTHLDPEEHVFENSLCSVCGYDERGSSMLQYKLSGDKSYYTVTGVSVIAPARLVIPETYLGRPVSEIAANAFSGQKSLLSVSIPENMLIIGDRAFSDCVRLSGIEIPAGVLTLGDGLFSGCTALGKITVAEENESYASLDGVLYDKALTQFLHVPAALGGKVRIPETVEEIGNGAFSGVKGVTEIELASGLKRIEGNAFRGCAALETLIIPETVIHFGKGMLSGCVSLRELTLPQTWQSDLTAPGQKEDGSIFGDSFLGYLFGADTYLGNSSQVPSSLKKIVITGGSTLNKYMFTECSALEEVSLPATITKIEENVFSGCASLKRISVEERNSAYSSKDGILYDKAGTYFVHIPQSLEGDVVLADGIARIADRQFKGMTGLRSVTVPGNVSSIGVSAFEGCTGLQTVALADGLRSIGSSAFYGCSALGSLALPQSVDFIGYLAFMKCDALQEVTFPEPNGWKRTLPASGGTTTTIDSAQLRNSATAARLLTTDYANYDWKRN